ncbi:uncharacterized protein NPIL_195831 [Nephila pilipes]|uniref:Uncharacterized protein n=1 Tax=Nephila pilipes TaxID=299642 RepID=A0A8X6TJA3_NEPPI|nr:uncharacterized protein NPIL_195831 [Nephila pilipes]
MVKVFRSGRNETADLFLTVWLLISQHQIDNVSGLFSKDCLWTTWELSAIVSLSHQMVWHILKKCFNMKKLSSQWVPHRLTYFQKSHLVARWLVSTSSYIAMKDIFMQCIIAIDKTWARAYDPELKRQSNQWHHPSSSNSTVGYRLC